MRLALFLLAAPLFSQAVFTPPVPPQPGTPGKLVATAGTGSTGISCTGVGDAAPAKNITWTCTIAGIAGNQFTIPATAGFTFHVGIGPTNILDILTKANATAGIDVQATVNAGPAVTGTF